MGDRDEVGAEGDPDRGAAAGAVMRAEAYGIDVSLLRAALRRTPAERMRELDAWLREFRGVGAAQWAMPLAVCGDLADAGVPYVVVDSTAAALHGSATMEARVRVCCATGDASLPALGGLLRRWEARASRGAGRLPAAWADRLRAGEVLELETTRGCIALHGAVPAVGGYEDCLAESEWIGAGARPVPVLGLAALMRSVRAGGARTEIYVLELEAIVDMLRSDTAP